MIECPACLRRYLVAASTLHPAPARLSRRNLPSNQKSHYGNSTSGPRLVRFVNDSIGQDTDTSYKESKLAHRLKSTIKAAQIGTFADEGDEKPSRLVERAVREELKWLRDPLKLAERVRATLQKNDEEKALALVRAASKSMNCVVSWNHIIDHNMRQGKTRIGHKLYNEV